METFTIELNYFDILLLRKALQEYKPSNVFHTNEQKNELIKYLESL